MIAAQHIANWRRDPGLMVRQLFKAEPDAWQQKALDIFPSQDPDKIRISMQACAGPGKSTILAWFGWNFLLCYGDRGEHPKGAAVSITSDNLKDNLWPEFSKWQGRAPILKEKFTWTKERIFANDHPETWFISARSWSKTANEEEQGRTLSGLHSKYVLVLVDESGEIPLSVLKAGEQALSNCVWGKIVQAGNPTSLEGMLYVAATLLKDIWTIIRITGDPLDPNRSPRIDKAWAQQQIDLYGRDNSWVMAYILGQFPGSSLNTLFGRDMVEAAMGRHLREDMYHYAQKRIGCDVARFGDDRTILFPRQGLASFTPVEMRGAKTNEIADRLIQAKMRWKCEETFIDDTGGWGAGVIDFMNIHGHAPVPVNASSKATNPTYFNKRAECWFRMADWVKRGGALPNIKGLVDELCAPTYFFHQNKMQLESKDQIKARLKYSPDMADALSLTFAHEEVMDFSQFPGRQPTQGRAVTEEPPRDEYGDETQGKGSIF